MAPRPARAPISPQTVAATTVMRAPVLPSSRSFCAACSPPPATSTGAASRSVRMGKYFIAAAFQRSGERAVRCPLSLEAR